MAGPADGCTLECARSTGGGEPRRAGGKGLSRGVFLAGSQNQPVHQPAAPHSGQAIGEAGNRQHRAQQIILPRKNLHVFQSPIPIYNATCPVILGTESYSRRIHQYLSGNRMATTKTDPKLSIASGRKSRTYDGLTREQLIEAYRIMYTSRRIDDREIILKRQQKIYFQMSGAGHEAIGVAAGMTLKPGYDWFYPYYRDRALCLALGAKPLEMFLQAVGAADDPSSGGRQMPSHWGYKRLNVVTQSSPTGSQILQAVGCAEAGRYFAQHPRAAEIPPSAQNVKERASAQSPILAKDARHGAPSFVNYRQFKDVTFHGDEIAYVSLGDGTTSEGEFWEAMNAAALNKLPVIFSVQDNGYAISVPVEVQTAGGSISRLVSGFPNFPFQEGDGTDPVASSSAFQRAAKC